MEPTDSEPTNAAPVSTILRIGLGLVFLIFGAWKAMTPVAWVIFLPNWISSWVANLDGLDGLGVLRMMGFFEAVLGIQLLIGLFTRTTALLCTALLGGIVFHIGFSQAGIRDVGLLFVALALSIAGGGAWSMDNWLKTEAATESEL